MLVLQMANFFAKYSCPKWNHADSTNKASELMHKILRRLCRYTFWGIASLDTHLHPRHESLGFLIDTYPRVYLSVGQWRETNDALVVDPANFVLGYATSYCAWKIRELTGHWPTNPVNIVDTEEYAERERKHDAKYWLEFLGAQDCCCGIVPSTYGLHNGHHYIGVQPDYGEYGLVVWFEQEADPNDPTKVWATSYIDKKFWGDKVRISDFTWVKIA